MVWVMYAFKSIPYPYSMKGISKDTNIIVEVSWQIGLRDCPYLFKWRNSQFTIG